MLVPLPPVSSDPGVRIKVQLPDGNPVNSTLPVDNSQVGWVMVPTIGGEGVGG